MRAATMVSAMAVGVVLAACAAPAQQAAVQEPAPQAQPALEPVGSYTVAMEFQGTPIPGVLHIRRGEQGGLTGSMVTELGGELPLTRVAFEGRRAEIRAATPQGDLIMRLEFIDNDRFQGGWELAGGIAGSASGQRRP